MLSPLLKLNVLLNVQSAEAMNSKLYLLTNLSITIWAPHYIQRVQTGDCGGQKTLRQQHHVNWSPTSSKVFDPAFLFDDPWIDFRLHVFSSEKMMIWFPYLFKLFNRCFWIIVSLKTDFLERVRLFPLIDLLTTLDTENFLFRCRRHYYIRFRLQTAQLWCPS